MSEEAMSAEPMDAKGLAGELRPRFGDIIENGWASERNPTRIGFFVREGRRTGRMNPGRYFEVTDGKGKFWELPVDREHKISVRPRGDGVGRDPRPTGSERSEHRDAPNPLPQQTGGGWRPEDREAVRRVLDKLTEPGVQTLDGMVDAIMAALPAPPPPGGDKP